VGAIVSATSFEAEAAGASQGGLDSEIGSAAWAGGELAPAASSASVVPCSGGAGAGSDGGADGVRQDAIAAGAAGAFHGGVAAAG
jgi:hypothetical protein